MKEIQTSPGNISTPLPGAHLRDKRDYLPPSASLLPEGWDRIKFHALQYSRPKGDIDENDFSLFSPELLTV